MRPDGAIYAYNEDLLVGFLTWLEDPQLYINYLWAEDPRCLVKMFAEFRRKYPNSLVYFHTEDDNVEMQRFIKLTGAKKIDDRYCVNTGLRGIAPAQIKGD